MPRAKPIFTRLKSPKKTKTLTPTNRLLVDKKTGHAVWDLKDAEVFKKALSELVPEASDTEITLWSYALLTRNKDLCNFLEKRTSNNVKVSGQGLTIEFVEQDKFKDAQVIPLETRAV